MPAENRRDEEALYHPMALYELQAKAPFINWTAHFADAMKIVGRKITEKEIVVVYAPEFLQQMTEIVKTYNKTPKGKM